MAGSILMSFKLTIGKISMLEIPAYHNEAIISIFPSKHVNKDFLFKVLPSRALAGDSKGAIKGNTLNSKSIATLLIPLPPLKEQARIVNKVDELMAFCDELENQHINSKKAHEKLVEVLLDTLTQSKDEKEFKENWQRIADHFETLFTTEERIDELKKTLLQLAVMGKLVPRDLNDEPASDLLKRIQTEKDKLISDKKTKKESKVFNGHLENLPSHWVLTNLASISLINPRNKAEDSTEVSFVKMDSIGSEFKSIHKEEKRTWEQVKKGYTHFAEGDVGVAKITPCFENSKACVFQNLRNRIGAGTTELHVLRILQNTLIPEYILIYFKSPNFLKIGESTMTGTAGQKRVPKEFIENNAFPLPPLNEQKRIVAKLDELFLICDELKSRIQQAREKQKQIADVLVSNALN